MPAIFLIYAARLEDLKTLKSVFPHAGHEDFLTPDNTPLFSVLSVSGNSPAQALIDHDIESVPEILLAERVLR
jgi:hypothetical protein